MNPVSPDDARREAVWRIIESGAVEQDKLDALDALAAWNPRRPAVRDFAGLRRPSALRSGRLKRWGRGGTGR